MVKAGKEKKEEGKGWSERS